MFEAAAFGEEEDAFAWRGGGIGGGGGSGGIEEERDGGGGEGEERGEEGGAHGGGRVFGVGWGGFSGAHSRLKGCHAGRAVIASLFDSVC